ncbi:MAG: DUF1501 domain-containing protein [Planctomycetota bacterium]
MRRNNPAVGHRFRSRGDLRRYLHDPGHGRRGVRLRHHDGVRRLAARRLVEGGVPYVTVNVGGWDTHKRNFESMNRLLPALDTGMSALLEDLDQRGLLESTIVWCTGEFGRTPKVAWQPPWNGGRGHHGQCYSAVVAGGGFQGGRVVGASDEVGDEVAERPVHPKDLFATMYGQLGIDPAGKMPNSRGLDVTVLDPIEEGRGKGTVKELL